LCGLAQRKNASFLTGLLPASPPLVRGIKESYRELSIFLPGKRKLQLEAHASAHGPKKIRGWTPPDNGSQPSLSHKKPRLVGVVMFQPLCLGRRHPRENTKFEYHTSFKAQAANQKQTASLNVLMTKTTRPVVLMGWKDSLHGLGYFDFGHSILFRSSDFVLRICGIKA
jgi:hypothetical protein